MEQKCKPKVSVVMGIYNCEKTLARSIESIIKQKYNNWELIMCDDGSTDMTYYIAKEYENKDNRIKVLKNNKNKGLAYSLNKCITNSNGIYIARQDADDYSHIDRLYEQIQFLEQNKSYAFVSTGAFLFDENGIWGQRNQIENGYSPKKMDIVKKNMFIHPTVVIKKNVLELVKYYTTEKYTYRTEDYDLWFKIYSKNKQGYIIDKSLYYFNEDRDSYDRKKFKYRIDEFKVRLKGYRYLEINPIYYIYSLRPIIIGLIPKKILRKLHRKVSKI